MGDNNSPEEKKSGCGLISVVFGRRSSVRHPKKKTTASSRSPDFISKPNNTSGTTPDHQKRRHDVALFSQSPPPPPHQKTTKPTTGHSPKSSHDQNDAKKPETTYQVYVSQGRRVPKEAVGISGELETMIMDHQRANVNRANNNSNVSSNLVRASSSNVMLLGNLGNLRSSNDVKNGQTTSPVPAGRYGANKAGQEKNSLCRALSTRMDPETLKMMGNEDYKNGRFAEALSLYEAAIAIDPTKASYRSNKSAALTALGRPLEAVLECREAIRMDPHYHRAHLRLATLYLRLGEAEKATYHYKHAGQEADRDDLAKVKSVQSHLSKCTEARRSRDWNSLIKETECAISSGADSAPQIYALQAEALFRLHRHQEADKALRRGPQFDVDDCTKFLGPIGNANLLVTRAQVDLALGRFDDALEAAERASRLDPSNREANAVTRRARAVAGARSRGNELFKAGRYSEACTAYGEGLENDPHNSVLLCNRAACRSKLGQFEKAVDDCTAALNLRPSYTKARLRRADCNAKLERWEISIMDYEVLLQESPEDEDVQRALSEARARLVKCDRDDDDDGITDDDSS